MSIIEVFIMAWGCSSIFLLLINMFGLFNHHRISPSEYYGDVAGMVELSFYTFLYMSMSPIMLVAILGDYFIHKIGGFIFKTKIAEFLFKERGK